MNKALILSIICFIIGIIFLGLGISQGQGKVYWVIFIPVFEGTGVFSLIGILLMIVGIVLLMISFSGGTIEWVDFQDEDEEMKGDHRDSQKQYRPRDDMRSTGYPRQKPHIRTGGVIFIGPIPIIWGSDKKIAYIMAVVALIIAIAFVIMILAWMF